MFNALLDKRRLVAKMILTKDSPDKLSAIAEQSTVGHSNSKQLIYHNT